MQDPEKGKILPFRFDTEARQKKVIQEDALSYARIVANRRRPNPEDLSEQLGNSSKRALEDAKYNWGNKDSK